MGRGRGGAGDGGAGGGALLDEEVCGLLDHFSSSLLSSILSAHLLAGLHLAEGEGALWGRAARKARKGRKAKGSGAAQRRRKGKLAHAGEPPRMRRLRRVALAASVPGHFSQGLRRW